MGQHPEGAECSSFSPAWPVGFYPSPSVPVGLYGSKVGIGYKYGLGVLCLVDFGNSRRKIWSELCDIPDCPTALFCLWG